MPFSEKIKAVKCHNCGLLQHESHLRCLNCKSQNFESIEASGECTLITFTILTAVPSEFREQKSIALGIVEFENGVRALGQINTLNNLKVGMHLNPIYGGITHYIDGKEIHTHIFEPV